MHSTLQSSHLALRFTISKKPDRSQRSDKGYITKINHQYDIFRPPSLQVPDSLTQCIFWIPEDTEWTGSGSGSGDSTDEDNPITDDEDGFKEGSGYKPKSPPPDTPKQSPPATHPDAAPPRADGEPKTSGDSTSNSNGTSTADSGAGRQKMSLSRALTTYLVPIVVMWFGGCLTEWL